MPLHAGQIFACFIRLGYPFTEPLETGRHSWPHLEHVLLKLKLDLAILSPQFLSLLEGWREPFLFLWSLHRNSMRSTDNVIGFRWNFSFSRLLWEGGSRGKPFLFTINSAIRCAEDIVPPVVKLFLPSLVPIYPIKVLFLLFCHIFLYKISLRLLRPPCLDQI